MATQLQQKEPIKIGLRSYGNDRRPLNPNFSTAIHFFDARDLESQIEEVVVRGCSEILLQGRLRGDFYVEITSARFCVSATADSPASAARAALAKAGVA